MRFAAPLLLLVLWLGAGCAPQPQIAEPAPVDLEAERDAILAADQAWAEAYTASNSPADAFVAALVDQAYLLPPGGPLAQGKEAIHSVISGLEAMPGFDISWTASAAEVGDGGNLGFTIGSYDMRMEGPEGGPIKILGKYMTVWEKQPDGSWKVAADMFNDNGPPTPVESPEEG